VRCRRRLRPLPANGPGHHFGVQYAELPGARHALTPDY
jgi:hypothetical protein